MYIRFMSQVPQTIDKIRLDIEKSMAVYDLMEPFKYKFQPEHIQKKWAVFSGPKEILELIESRNAVLEKEKITFMEQMKISQEDFKEQAESMERTIGNFYQYTNINQHEDVAKIVKTVNEQLAYFQDEARKFNSRE